MFYDVFGPYEVEKDGPRVSGNQRSLWKKADKECKRISCARGIYFFGISPAGTDKIIPYYVGKADITTFDPEVFSSQNIRNYNRVHTIHRYQRYTPYVFLMPRYTNKKWNRLSGAGMANDIGRLESMMIDWGLWVNWNLLNKQEATFQRKIEIRGVLNSGSGNISDSARKFREMMGLS